MISVGEGFNEGFGPRRHRGVRTVSGFSSRAQHGRTIGSGPRAGETFDVTVDTQLSALLEFASGPIATATFSFNAPIAFRELEVQGTEAVIRLPDPNRFDGSVLLYKNDVKKGAPDEWLKIPAQTGLGAEILAEGSAEICKRQFYEDYRKSRNA